MSQKRQRRLWYLVASAVLLAVVMMAVGFGVRRGFAASPHTATYGPFTDTRPDEGSCGNIWATDDAIGIYTVNTTPNPDGTYSIVEDFKGSTFTTTGTGNSPGSCDPGNPVSPDPTGVSGKVKGSWDIVVSGGTFDSSATCTDAPGIPCVLPGNFVHAIFGDSATWSIPSWKFTYDGGGCGKWRSATPDQGGDRGDITC